ncbi:papain-like cysteine protease family protein [Adlercreutzia faecimuris]|uniref:papain-like cysteine protease family protein n=1 Tax=Adlercreutzia faecimuris TaxID=2897341 RepID=UPI0024129465|nr:papain-like cysteine protease family protein [Adlercreutzia sp. JBNU-10]
MPTRRHADPSHPSPHRRPAPDARRPSVRRKPTRRRAKGPDGVAARRRARLGADDTALPIIAPDGAAQPAPAVGETAAASSPAGGEAPVPAAASAAAPASFPDGAEAAALAAAMLASAGAADADPAAGDAAEPHGAGAARPTQRSSDTPRRTAAERARALLLGPALRAARPRAAASSEGFYVPARQAHTPAASSLVAPHTPGTPLNWAFVIGLAGLLCMAAVIAFSWAVPPRSADAQEYFAPDLSVDVSTPQSGWARGTVPAVYQGDPRWAQAAFGVTTIGESGAAPCALCMAYVEETGDGSRTPLDFAGWAEGAGAASAAEADVTVLLTDGAAAAGLDARPLDPDALALRRAIGNGRPVICVTRPGTFDDHVSCVVLTGINEHSQLVIVDPTSSERSAESWTFDEVLDASTALYAYARA